MNIDGGRAMNIDRGRVAQRFSILLISNVKPCVQRHDTATSSTRCNWNQIDWQV